jgi:hypothetical protein
MPVTTPQVEFNWTTNPTTQGNQPRYTQTDTRERMTTISPILPLAELDNQSVHPQQWIRNGHAHGVPLGESNINNRRISFNQTHPYDTVVSVGDRDNTAHVGQRQAQELSHQLRSGVDLIGIHSRGLAVDTTSFQRPFDNLAAPVEAKPQTFPTYHVPKTKPHSHINMEMPKYTHELSKQGLRLFIRRFELWAAAKRMDDQTAKLAFRLGFQNCTGKQYFLIHDGDLMDPHVPWSVFIERFLQNCPMEVTDGTSIIKILGKQQQPDEKGSIFVQRIRFLIGTDFPKYDEKEIVSLMMEGLQSELRHYLGCRGTPLTYADLVKNIQVY